MYKNVAGQKALIYAHDVAADVAKTGDAANITGFISKDGAAGVATNDVNPTEVGGGIYAFDLTQAETNCDVFALYASSTTPDVKTEPIIAYTKAQSFSSETIIVESS